MQVELKRKFDSKNASEKQLFFNEIYSLIFVKKSFVSKVFQLLDAMRLNDKETINSCKTTSKAHVTMDEKIEIPLYEDHLYCLLSKCCWKVTKIRVHYTFEQKEFKKDFVIMNQVSRKKAHTDVKKGFYKLMNNANFGYDCCINADNCYFSPIYDEIDELSYAKRYQNVFDQSISDFASSEILERQIEEEFLNKIAKLDQNDNYYEASKNSLELQKKKLDTVFPRKNQAKKGIKNTIKDTDEKPKEEEKYPKTKSIFELDPTLSCSVKSLAVKK